MFRSRLERPRMSVARALSIFLALTLASCASPIASPSPSSGPGASHEPAPAGFALLGGWTTTITREDLRAGGVTEDGFLNENSGVFTWFFEADGTWREVQASLDDSPVMNPVFSGYYTVTEDIVLVVTEFPEQYRDDGIRYAFEVMGDAATLDVLDPPDSVMPILVESHPWTRVQP